MLSSLFVIFRKDIGKYDDNKIDYTYRAKLEEAASGIFAVAVTIGEVTSEGT